MKLGTSDKVILGVGYTLLGLFVLAVFVPLVYVVLASFMDPNVLNNQGLSFNFKDWTLDAYRRVLENDMIWPGLCQLILLFSGIYGDLGVSDAARRIPDVQEGVCWTELFQRDLCDHDVLRRRDDPHVHPDQHLHMVNTIWRSSFRARSTCGT